MNGLENKDTNTRQWDVVDPLATRAVVGVEHGSGRYIGAPAKNKHSFFHCFD